MAYFNGSIHGFNSNDGYIPPKPVTKVFCDICAVDGIPLDTAKPEGRRHWDSGFRWAPVFGTKCDSCGGDC